MGDWAKKISNNIDAKLEGTRDKEIRFYRIEEFKRNIQRTDDFSVSCPFCLKQKLNIDSISKKIDVVIHVPGKERREYDRLISNISSHMQKEHHFFAPYHYTYLFSFFGMVSGLLLGYLLLRIFPFYSWEMLSAGFTIGMVTGYFWGVKKDKKIRSEKRLM